MELPIWIDRASYLRRDPGVTSADIDVQETPGIHTRRAFLRSAIGASLAIPLTGSLLGACTSSSGGFGSNSESSQSQPAGDVDAETPSPEPELPEPFADAIYGGQLRIALIDEPPTFDIHQTTTSTTAFVSWHIFEALFTWDAELNVMPEMLDEYTISDDGLVYRFTLRKDMLFHDGTPLTTDDVVASIERWGRLVGLGQSLLEAVDSMVIEDEHVFEVQLTEPFGSLPVALARQNQGCAIYPAWVIEEEGDDPIQTLIGTGPYRFVEHRPDQHILLERFEVYTPAPGEVDGYGGAKHRFLDQLMFVAVSDEASRVAGLQAGDYDYLESISPDQIEELEAAPEVVVELDSACCYPNLVINQRSELMTQQPIRKAVQLALDHEPILQAGYGDGFFRLDPSLLMRETPWHTRAGDEYYDVHDIDRAAHLLAEAGYDGTPVRFMVTQAYRDLYNSSLVIAQQLEDVGFEVDMQVMDWATLSDRRNDPDLWDLYLTLATFRPDPIMRNLTCDAAGWWCDDEKEELLHLVQVERDFQARFEIWEEVQRLFYYQVPRIKIGDTYPVLVRSPRIQNFPTTNQLQPAFWNIWLDDSMTERPDTQNRDNSSFVYHSQQCSCRRIES
jgi:peptide/nickel transport system substrate-binding protein